MLVETRWLMIIAILNTAGTIVKKCKMVMSHKTIHRITSVM